jgi:NAD(P)-dependent dehydrogenase (short-subunit alcohol dehydrogenase family)
MEKRPLSTPPSDQLDCSCSKKKQRCSDDEQMDDHDTDDAVVTLDAVGISPEAVQNAVSVLNRIASINGTSSSSSSSSSTARSGTSIRWYTQCPELRPLRKAMTPFVDYQLQQRYQGKSPQEFHNGKFQRMQSQRQRMKETCEQRKYLNTTQLRKGRLDQLNALLVEQQHPEHDEEEVGTTNPEQEETLSCTKHTKGSNHSLLQYLIPDGAVTTASTTAKQEHSLMMESPPTTTSTTTTVEGGQSQHQQIVPKLRSCYVCKKRFRELHSFYDQLCPTCAMFNYTKRHQTVHLETQNYIALVTGGRVKIGFHTCLKLLRAGCTVIATTRFPNNAIATYRNQPDFSSFAHRLHIYGLDLRDVTSIELFVQFLKRRYTHIDILINNACQTVRRPAGYYYPTLMEERRLYDEALLIASQSSQNSNNTTTLDHLSLLHHTQDFEHVLQQQKQQQSNHQPLLLSSSSTQSNMSDNHDPLSLAGTTEINDNNVIESSTSNIIKAMVSSSSSNITTSTRNGKYGQNSTPFTLLEWTGISHSAAMSQMTLLPDDMGVDTSVLPEGLKDINGQQLDLRTRNSWLLKMEEVTAPELVETLFINAIAPFLLNSKLKPLMTMRDDTNRDRNRFIINVSAMEGKFYRYKTPNHPHTNMAKAALNMLTRTSAEDLATNYRIYMNSVDTGWINDENPLEKASRIARENHFPNTHR